MVRTVALVGSALAVLAGCGRAQSPSAEGATPRSPAATTPRGDAGPHEAENNGWRQRAALTPGDKRAAQAAARRIRPALERLCQAGDFSPESVRRVLAGLGYGSDAIQVRAFHAPPWATVAPAGAVYGVRVGYRGCVHGDVRPERVLADVDGPTAEWGCIEPGPTHWPQHRPLPPARSW